MDPTQEAGQLWGAGGSLLSQQWHCLSGLASASLRGLTKCAGKTQARAPPLPLAGVHMPHGPHPGLSLLPQAADGTAAGPRLPHGGRAAGPTMRISLWEGRWVWRGLGPLSLTLGCPGWPHVPSRLWTTSQYSLHGSHEEAQESRLFCRPAEQGCTLGSQGGPPTCWGSA